MGFKSIALTRVHLIWQRKIGSVLVQKRISIHRDFARHQFYLAVPNHLLCLRRAQVASANVIIVQLGSAASVSAVAIGRPSEGYMEMLLCLLWRDLKGHACFWIEWLLRKECAMLHSLSVDVLSQLECDPACHKRNSLLPCGCNHRITSV